MKKDLDKFGTISVEYVVVLLVLLALLVVLIIYSGISKGWMQELFGRVMSFIVGGE